MIDAIASAQTDTPISGCSSGFGSDTIILSQDEYISESSIQITTPIKIKGNGHTITFDSPSNNPSRLFTVFSSSLEIFDTNFVYESNEDSEVENGGFLLADNAVINLIDVKISGFRARSFGGALYLHDTDLSVDSSKFIENSQIDSGYILGGGAIYISSGGGIIKISDTEFKNNNAKGRGGAILREGSSIAVANSIFSTNSALTGAVIDSSSWSEDKYINIFGSEFSQNSSNQGGAIVWRGPMGVVDITRSLFSKNTGFDNGSALEVFGTGTVIVSNTTFSGNKSYGRGSSIFDHDSNTTLKISYNSFVGNIDSVFSGTISSLSFEAFEDSFVENNLFFGNVGGDCFFGSQNNLNISGNLSGGGVCGSLYATGVDVVLSANGGETKTHKLFSSSNAIDKAISDNSVQSVCPSVDQRNVFRPFDGNLDGIIDCDVGAFEFTKKPILAPGLRK